MVRDSNRGAHRHRWGTASWAPCYFAIALGAFTLANCATSGRDQGGEDASEGGESGRATGGGSPSQSGGAAGLGGAASGGRAGSAGANAAGGTAGSAGANAAGGTAGSANAAGGTGGNAAGGVLFSDGFEAGTAGQQPAGWDNFISYVRNNKNPNGQVSALVDTTRAHSGSKSIRFAGGAQPAMLTRSLPANTNKLYVRAFFWLTRQLGMNPGANHETLIGIRKLPDGANDEVRFGEIKGAIGTNEVPSDNISPKQDLWGKGPVIAANSWQCIEVAFLANEPTHKLFAWNGDTLVHSITAPDQWNNGALNAAWMSGKFVNMIVGWHSFSGINTELWMDDLVVSTERVGCPK
ncbi:MAG: hypothetical protein SF187_20060 [Deltaproteobacteria bacterium]|nr:hypothetical protein [Deltaproteobacteria bacterium]